MLLNRRQKVTDTFFSKSICLACCACSDNCFKSCISLSFTSLMFASSVWMWLTEIYIFHVRLWLFFKDEKYSFQNLATHFSFRFCWQFLLVPSISPCNVPSTLLFLHFFCPVSANNVLLFWHVVLKQNRTFLNKGRTATQDSDHHLRIMTLGPTGLNNSRHPVSEPKMMRNCSFCHNTKWLFVRRMKQRWPSERCCHASAAASTFPPGILPPAFSLSCPTGEERKRSADKNREKWKSSRTLAETWAHHPPPFHGSGTASDRLGKSTLQTRVILVRCKLVSHNKLDLRLQKFLTKGQRQVSLMIDSKSSMIWRYFVQISGAVCWREVGVFVQTNKQNLWSITTMCCWSSSLNVFVYLSRN